MQPVDSRPCVVPYFYLHGTNERVNYPSARAWGDHRRLALRYLECVLTQVASLRLTGADCDVVFVTNALTDASELGRDGARLIDAITSYDAEVRHAEYRHRLSDLSAEYQGTRYMLDAIAATADGERTVLITDADCVWIEPRRVFEAAGRLDGALGCVELNYPDDWDVNGYTPVSIGELAECLGGTRPARLPWVGGELLAGSGPALRAMLDASADVDEQASSQGRPMTNEEHLFTLLRALGRVRFASLNHVAGRISTGARHTAANPERPLELGFWHLPSEKGLSLRRSARDVVHGRERRLARDVGDPHRSAQRFNVGEVSSLRRLRDNGSLLQQRGLALLARMR